MKKVFTYCLSIDIISSTQILLNESTAVRDSFNIALSNLIQPFLVEYDLEDSYVKFTGDGWIINIEEPSKLTNLAVLSLVLRHKFHTQILDLTGIEFPYQWQLRMALSSGHDIKVEINGNIDFVGDSIRRSNRILSFCGANEIIVDMSTQRDIFRDFEIENKLIEPSGKVKYEYDIGQILFLIKDAKYSQLKNAEILVKYFHDIGNIYLKNNVIDDILQKSNNPELSNLDKVNLDRTSMALQQVGDIILGVDIYRNLKKSGYNRNLVLWNKKVHLSTDFESAKKILEEMKAEGIKPDEITFNTLMNKVEDFESAKKILDEMKAEGLKPDEITYSTLMNKVNDFESAKKILDEMRAEGIKPDEITYSTLMNKVEDFESAKKIIDEMKAEGIKPNEITYSTLMNKVEDFESAKKILDEMKAEGIKPDEITFNTLMNKVDNFKSAKKIIDEMKAEGINPNEITFNTLMNKVEDFESAKKILDEMRAEGIKPNEITFNTLMNKVEDFESAKKILDEMNAEGINPNEITFNTLMRNESRRDQS